MVWVPPSGAYFPDAWYPSALGAAALLVLTAIATGRALPQVRAARVALLGFAGLVALNYVSMLWAGAPGDALDAANKLLLYLAVAWTVSLVSMTPNSLTMLLAVWSLGVAAFCAVGLIQATGAARLDSFFFDQRYSDPLAYPNATAALAIMGMWPALILSARREIPAWIRVGLSAVAVFLADFAFLPQSRAALVGLVLTAPLVLALSANRVALLARAAVVGGALALSIPRTIHLDQTISADRPAAPALGHAASGMLLTTIAALVVGSLLVLAEARLRSSGYPIRGAGDVGRRGAIVLASAALAVVAGGAIIVTPAIGSAIRSVWKSGKTDAGTGSTRLFSGTPEERFDYIRVAVHIFESAPVLGIGAGNFGRRYDSLRHFQKHSQYVHNLPLRVLSETGVVGLALLVTIVAALAIGLLGAVRELDGVGRACAVAAFAVAAYFFVHASVDWVDEYPVLAAPALALPLAAIGLRTPKRRASASRVTARLPRLPSGRLNPRAVRAGAFALLLVTYAGVMVALSAPYLETRYVERAFATFRSRPSGAYHDLSRAASLNPFSAEPLISEGTIALSLDDSSRARSAFERAIRRQPSWYAYLELALLDAQAGQFNAALTQVSHAASLDRDDPVLTEARSEILRHKQIDPVSFNLNLLQGAEATVFHQQRIK